MKFSIRLNNDLPVATYVALAQAAEKYGFDQFWVSHDLFLRSAWVILTAVAQATSRIQIGTGLVNPYTANLAEIAMAAATLDELSAGRFNLGLGAGAADFLGWVGIAQTRPLAAMRESIVTLRKLWRGEFIMSEGVFVKGWTTEAYLRAPHSPIRSIPIYLGAMSEKMLELTGELADGGLPLLFPPEHFTTIKPLIERGAQRVGRAFADVDVAACVWCSIASDGAAARAVLAEKIAYYGHALSPLIYQQLGLEAADFAPIRQAVVVEGNLQKGAQMVSEAMLRIGIVGTATEVIRRCENLVQWGAQHLSFGPPLGPDPLEAVERLGQQVIPYFNA